MLEINKIYNMSCLEGMGQMDDESVDLIVTDPPYGLKFMGKDWDKAIPPVDVWKECLRVLKSGAFAFVMSSPRQDVLSRMIVNLEDAGFEMGFTSIYYTYASGFPKAMNIGKAVDKRLGVEREVAGYKKDVSHIERKDRNIEEQKRSSGIPFAEVETKIQVETIPATPQAKALNGSYGGFQPKPSVEVIIVCMKPLSERTYVDQAMKSLEEKRCVICGYAENDTVRLDCGCYMCDECLLSGGALDHEHDPHKTGSGCTWLDDCKIPISGNDYKGKGGGGVHGIGEEMKSIFGDRKRIDIDHSQGRFPANLLVSDDVLNDGKISSNARPNCFGKKYKSSLDGHIYSKYNNEMNIYLAPQDSGSFSRYFDLDAWTVEKGVKDVFPFMIVPKASKSEKNAGCEDLPQKQANPNYGKGGFKRPTDEPERKIAKRGNCHPTCKPVKLMAYLITLGSREGDLILDPYIGSGTTGIACVKMKRNYIGFENDIEMGYFEIAEKRIAHESKKIKGFF